MRSEHTFHCGIHPRACYGALHALPDGTYVPALEEICGRYHTHRHRERKCSFPYVATTKVCMLLLSLTLKKNIFILSLLNPLSDWKINHFGFWQVLHKGT